MPRFRVWLREHVLNFLRDPERKSNKRNSFRKSIMISAPIPLGSLAIDMTDPLPIPTSRSVQDVSATHPLLQRQQTLFASADQLVPPPIDMIVEDDEPDTEDDERPRTPPPTDISSASAHADGQDVSPTRRPALPTRNFSRRFSSRFSSHSANSVSSYGENDTKRMSQMSGVSATSKAEIREEWAELRLSRRWSQRMSGAFETYQTHTRNYTPMGVI